LRTGCRGWRTGGGPCSRRRRGWWFGHGWFVLQLFFQYAVYAA
jgi:hypothetical protein